MSDLKNNHWQMLAEYNLEMLISARLQLHHVAQLLAATGKYLVPARPDDSHTSLSWLPTLQILVSEMLPVSGEMRLGLRPADATLVMMRDKRIGPSFDFADHTLEEGLMWLRSVLNAEGLDGDSVSLTLHYEIPAHPLGEGRVFSARGADLAGLGKYWHNAHLLLSEIRSRHPQSSPIRCWPHHFDIATLITVAASPDPETRKTIGVGLSPGDDGYPMPYFYVTPWPYPDAKSLDSHALAGEGHWHTREWIGAVLTADRICARDPRQQLLQTQSFLQSAISACQHLLT